MKAGAAQDTEINLKWAYEVNTQNIFRWERGKPTDNTLKRDFLYTKTTKLSTINEYKSLFGSEIVPHGTQK